MKTPIDKIKSLQANPQNQWIREFLQSVRAIIEAGKPLSKNQSEKLAALWKS